MRTVLMFCARHGRVILVASLGVGLTSSTLAMLVKPHIDILIALLLFTACLRVGPSQAFGAVRDLKASFAFTIALQVLLPLLTAFVASMAGLGAGLILPLVLLTSAPAVSGSPHLVALMGFEPAPALRQLVVGTALLPLTILPVFVVLPEFGDVHTIVWSSLRLLAVIAAAAIIAFIIRLTILKTPSDDQLVQMDGASTILLAIVVFGLMAAIQTEMAIDPLNVLITLGAVCTVNFGLQIITTLILLKTKAAAYAIPMGVVAGNRNVALFLTALPAATTHPLLLFLACYQIPMYLTPIIMKWFYQRVG